MHPKKTIIAIVYRYYLRICTVLLPFLLIHLAGSAQIITTIAGSGFNGNTGNNGPALCAGILYPPDVYVDPAGNIYIATSNSVRKVDGATGIITTIAGSDSYGYGGDGGPATQALFKFIIGICGDGSGNLYIAEYSGHRIRKINTATGIVTTVAGNGTAGYSGDGGPAINAAINTPHGIRVDKLGNIYFADTYNNRIRKINVATGIITTVAGTGSPTHTGDGGAATAASTPYPVYLCIDVAGNIFFTEVYGGITSRVRKINAVTGIISTIAGTNVYGHSGDGGPASAANLYDPYGICVDAAGNIYVGQYDDGRIRKIDAATGIITTIAGGSPGFSGDGGFAANAQMGTIEGLWLDANNALFVADMPNHRIRKIDLTSNTPVNPVYNISITASANNICAGTPVTFTATGPPAAGQGFTYTWKKNGNTVGTNNTVYTDATLNNGDVITCRFGNSASCLGGVVESSPITMIVTPVLTPGISITADKNPVCSGSSVTFNATATNPGTSPVYQWKINGNNAGTGNTAFTTSSLADGDVVSCTMMIDPAMPCITGTTATSNNITVKVLSATLPVANISVSDNSICAGKPVTFYAQVLNGTADIHYQWLLNNAATGTDANTFSSVTLKNNDKISCKITSASLCSGIEVVSGIITMIIYDLPVIDASASNNISIMAGQQAQLLTTVTGSIDHYTWSPASGLISTGTLSPVTIPMTHNTVYTLTVTSTDGCTVSKDIPVKVYRPFRMPNAFSPNGDGINEVFRIPSGSLLQLIDFAVFDRWGNKVFSTTEINTGWDGTYKGQPANAGTYVFVIKGIIDDNNTVIKGTVELIR